MSSRKTTPSVAFPMINKIEFPVKKSSKNEGKGGKVKGKVISTMKDMRCVSSERAFERANIYNVIKSMSV